SPAPPGDPGRRRGPSRAPRRSPPAARPHVPRPTVAPRVGPDSTGRPTPCRRRHPPRPRTERARPPRRHRHAVPARPAWPTPPPAPPVFATLLGVGDHRAGPPRRFAPASAGCRPTGHALAPRPAGPGRGGVRRDAPRPRATGPPPGPTP